MLETEALIHHALATLLAGRTSVVAHRRSTIRHADLILVIEEGRIVERATHNELPATSGRYPALYRRQLREVAAPHPWQYHHAVQYPDFEQHERGLRSCFCGMRLQRSL